MTEESSQPVQQPPPPARPQKPDLSAEEQEAAMRAELAKARSRSKVMTAVAVSLGTILIIIAGVGYVVYTKISAAKENFEEVFRAMPAPQGGLGQENRMLAGQGVYSSTSMPVSSLGMFAGGLPAQLPSPANVDPAEMARVNQAISKYAERPVMKEFLSDLKKNPEVAEALARTKDGNPMALIIAAQNAKGLDKVMAKYVTRPDFMKTLMEIAGDPALKSVAGGMGVNMPAVPQGQPAGMPVVSVPQGPAQSGGSDGDGEPTLDPSAISGAPAPQQPGSPRAKSVPSPVDSGR